MKYIGKRVDWSGCGTALVTPFDDKGRIAFGVLQALVEWQIAQGIDFLCPAAQPASRRRSRATSARPSRRPSCGRRTDEFR